MRSSFSVWTCPPHPKKKSLPNKWVRVCRVITETSLKDLPNCAVCDQTSEYSISELQAATEDSYVMEKRTFCGITGKGQICAIRK